MLFNSEELNSARKCLVDKVVEYFLAQGGVEAIYIQGSVAAGSADEFSDIDFRIVIQQEVYEQFILERFSAPKHWGEWLFNEWASRSWVCVSHFKPFNKVDVLYFKPEELKPSPWFLLPTQVIYDPKKLVQQVIQLSQESKFTLLNIEDVDRLISKGLAYAEEVYRRVMRGELFYAQSQLDSFRWILIQFDDYLHHSLPSSGFGSPSHFEQRGSEMLIEVMQLSYTLLEQKSILKALGLLLQAYQTQVVELHQILILKRDRDRDLYWIDTILELCNSNY
ncbi:nucleotidyltransferase domain-containing protein [Pleurocapsa sp. PCC 7319]|uniref:nucleotidyltransferase domain-containing protein n=1 Tax=Pleurocapsa sp. PCC 7319 TaxID=118161 RepID=UPI0003482A0F|nr:nucleotidyltransferase domain-containing protein [Pleurocapsa sp. PCC 7319]